MAARTRRKAAVGDAAFERSGCVDGGLWGRERRAFADCCGSRSPGVYTHRYACYVCLHRGSDAHAHAYTHTYSCSHPDVYTERPRLLQRRHPRQRQVPTPVPTPTLSLTSTPTLAPTAESTPTPASTPDPLDSSGGDLIDLDEDTTWQDVYDALSSSEQSCIRDAIDEDALEALVELNVLKAEAVAGPEELGAITCLEPEKAAVLYTSAVIASMGDASLRY